MQRKHYFIDEDMLYKKAINMGNIDLFPTLLRDEQIEQTFISRGESILKEHEYNRYKKSSEKQLNSVEKN